MSKTKNEGEGDDVSEGEGGNEDGGKGEGEGEGDSYFHRVSLLTFLPFDIFTFDQSWDNHICMYLRKRLDSGKEYFRICPPGCPV